ncbi:hypothetical protein [Niallia circulans]|uniref:hypothetical protein n=1 Tax=Niallia circulans TaxID=1397 RepID=UPI00300AA4C7
MEKLIHQKNIEFGKALERFKNCNIELVSEKRKMYNVISMSGVTWKEKSPKWGVVAEGKERLRIDLDYPVHSFTEEELHYYTGLPLKRNIAKPNGISHINPTVGGEKYDTLRIILYGEELAMYDFSNKRFKELLTQMVTENIC